MSLELLITEIIDYLNASKLCSGKGSDQQTVVIVLKKRQRNRFPKCQMNLLALWNAWNTNKTWMELWWCQNHLRFWHLVQDIFKNLRKGQWIYKNYSKDSFILQKTKKVKGLHVKIKMKIPKRLLLEEFVMGLHVLLISDSIVIWCLMSIWNSWIKFLELWKLSLMKRHFWPSKFFKV